MGLPTYDRPDYVREAVASLRAQSWRDFRAVVSDNASPGGGGDMVRTFVESLGDSRITFVQQAENGGEYGQGRYFFEQAGDAEYFCILHDDDLLSPAYFKRAVAALDAAPDAAVFVANPWLFDAEGRPSDAQSRAYRRTHRRARRRGRFPILDTHMGSGFTPISGTLFRTDALRRSGFVDADCHGNFPFELNIFTRLGDIGAVGWFDPDILLGFRYHPGQLRNTLGLMANPQVVATMLRILERRRYGGAPERRRRAIVARLHRAQAQMALAQGDPVAARAALAQACAANPLSPSVWAMRAHLRLAGAMT
ncbi:glycosyltransferase family 2 protein [Sphingobium sp. 3R8]|uniref:glycosyltransferase family 2 protein n=1 Tax=Sphingobium sp. 3R8 TaxID=2874921 RepID=UPI001CCE7B6C|nr:glycosyltransferase [Sphingobium sp. 3R8]MBZ9646780.1 glycosyltransferase family 2 protein [Sphingobium sp. 3R8]